MIEGHAITKSYGGQTVLREVDASVARGEIVALIGPNGSGKSTLLRALSLLDEPTSGEVKIDGVQYTFPKTNGNGPAPPWPRVTMVFQQLFLWPHLTVRENIELPLRCLGAADATARTEEAIDEFDLGSFSKRHPNEISLGQRQRATIARAFVLQPDYLLLDEITSALDIEQVKSVMDRLEERRSDGTGIILVTHFLGLARRTADRVLFMWDGSIKESGGPEVLEAPQTAECRRFLSLVMAESR